MTAIIYEHPLVTIDRKDPTILTILSFVADQTSAWLGARVLDAAALPTNAGLPIPAEASHALPTAALAEIRRLTGFTWEQLSDLFDVSRRTLHFWASGKPLSAEHEQHLQRVLAVLRAMDRGSVAENRTLLLAPGDGGAAPFEALRGAEYERFLGLVGRASHSAPRKQIHFSQEAQAARRPLSPEVLLGAVPEKPRPARGRLLGSFPIAKKKRGE